MTSDDKLGKSSDLQASIAEAFGLESTLHKLAHPEPVTLAKFVEDRLRDDECYALNAFRDYGEDAGDTVNGPEWSEIWPGTVQCGPRGELIGTGDSGLSRHIIQHDPARVLRQVEAGRRILARHCKSEASQSTAYCAGCAHDPEGWPEIELNDCSELRDLAAVHSDHKDFRKEWAA